MVHTVTTGSPGPRGMQLVGDSLWFAAGAELFEVDADTGQVRRTLALPGVTHPYDVAVTGDAAWVTDSRGPSVTRLPLSGGPAQQVPVGTGSTGVVAAGGAIWVALAATDNLIRLDPDTGAVLSRPSLPAPGLALNVIGPSVWAGVPDADLVVSFDAASGRQTRRWAVGDYPPYVVGDRRRRLRVEQQVRRDGARAPRPAMHAARLMQSRRGSDPAPTSASCRQAQTAFA